MGIQKAALEGKMKAPLKNPFPDDPGLAHRHRAEEHLLLAEVQPTLPLGQLLPLGLMSAAVVTCDS